MIPSIADDQVSTALRSFMLGVLPAGVECVQGQPNRVPEVASDDFVIFTISSDGRLSLNVDTYDTGAGTVSAQESRKVRYQLDVHGPNSTDNARVITTLWRSQYACRILAPTFQPLYADDGQQLPFINGEGQYENRWVLMLYLQVNPAVSTPIEFADTVTVTLVEAEADVS